MGHSKVKNIRYEKLSTQPYLTSQLFDNRETKLIAALRSRTHEGFKHNFSNLYGGDVKCQLNCWKTGEIPESDSQEHLLHCSEMQKHIQISEVVSDKLEYCDIFGKNTKKLKELAVLFTKLLNIKEELISKSREPALLDPCTCVGQCLCNSYAIFTPVSVVYLSGNK